MGARHRHRATCLALVRAPAYMGARFGGCVPVPAARGNHVQPLPRRVTGIYSSIPGSPAAVAAKPCRGAPERLLRPPGSAIAAFPAGFLSGRPLRLTELAGALAGPAFLTYVNNQYSTFMPYVKNDPALSPIPALPSSHSHHIPHPMPDGEKSGTGRGSPSRQGRTGSRTEWARHPAQCRAVSAHGRAERRAVRCAPPHQSRTGKRKNAVPASRSGAAPGEKHIDAGRRKCGTGRVVLSYQSRARTADGAGMEARPPGRSVERLAAAQA